MYRPDVKGINKDYWKDVYTVLSTVGLGERKMNYLVKVTYEDLSTETFDVKECNTRNSAFFKVLNYHRRTLDVQRGIIGMTTDVTKVSYKEIW